MSRESLWQIDATLRERGFAPDDSTPGRYLGRVQVGNTRVRIAISIRDTDFIKLPTVELLDVVALGEHVLAHVDAHGNFCFAADGTLRLDRYEPGRSILTCLNAATEALEDTRRIRTDALAEFPAYWANSGIFCLSSLKTSAELHVLVRSDTPSLWFASEQEHLPSFKSAGLGAMLVASCSALVTGPRAEFPPRNVGSFVDWFLKQGFSEAQVARCYAALARSQLIIVSGSNGAVGITCAIPQAIATATSSRRIRPEALPKILRRKAKDLPIERYRIYDASADFVAKRNLTTTLEGKRIAILGMGTIGSHLAKFCAQSGAGFGAPLSVWDHDVLAPGNIGRHLLGYSDLGQNKAQAVAKFLQHVHPSIDVVPRAVDALLAWDEVKSNDLILDATGSEAFSDVLNALHLANRQSSSSPPIIHGWVFGNGVAAQCFFNGGENSACLRCLRVNLDRPNRFDPRRDVTEQVVVTPASCTDGAHVAFSVAAPVTAAAMMLTMSLDWKSGNLRGTHRTTTLDAERGRTLKSGTPAPSEHCPACRAAAPQAPPRLVTAL